MAPKTGAENCHENRGHIAGPPQYVPSGVLRKAKLASERSGQGNANMAAENKTCRAATKWLQKEVLKQPNSPLSYPNSPYNLTTAKGLPSHFRHRSQD